MRVLQRLAAVAAGLLLWAGAARAAVDIQVDLSTQTMHVRSAHGVSHDWPVSTARMGFVTPRGHYRVQSLQAMHYSHKYHNAPMPHAIFFHGGYAIHGTYETASLGAAASHGCVRLSPAHAADLFRMVRAEGASISIVGSARESVQLARRRSVEPVLMASDEVGRPAPAAGRSHRAQGGLRPLLSRGVALGYAPIPRPIPTYRAWLDDPFDAVLRGD